MNSARKSLDVKLFLVAVVLVLVFASIGLATSRKAHYKIVPRSTSAAEWQALLQPYEGCELPCWWGIRPGMQYAAVEAMMPRILPDYDIDYSYAEIDGTAYLSTEYEEHGVYAAGEIVQPLYFSVSFPVAFQRNGTATYSAMRMDFAGDHAEEARPIANYFRPSNLIAEYGTPDVIKTDMTLSDESFAVKILMFYWEVAGLFVKYDIGASATEELSEKNGSYCFGPEYLTNLRIFLTNSDDQQAVNKVFGRIFPAPFTPPPDLNRISDMSYDDFAAILTDNDDCLSADAFRG